MDNETLRKKMDEQSVNREEFRKLATFSVDANRGIYFGIFVIFVLACLTDLLSKCAIILAVVVFFVMQLSRKAITLFKLKKISKGENNEL